MALLASAEIVGHQASGQVDHLKVAATDAVPQHHHQRVVPFQAQGLAPVGVVDEVPVGLHDLQEPLGPQAVAHIVAIQITVQTAPAVRQASRE